MCHREDLFVSPTIGFNEDGYQAIQFAIDNVPFRNDTRIARNMLLITDEGRTAIPEGAGLTFESVQVETLLLSRIIT